MPLNLLFVDTVVGTGTGDDPLTVTIPYSGVTGDNCCAVLRGTARSITDGTFTVSAEVDTVAMNLEIEDTGALGGFGRASSSVFTLPLGGLDDASGEAVFTVDGVADDAAGRVATFEIWGSVDQTTPVNDTDSNTSTSAATSTSRNITSATTDVALDVITFGGQPATVTPGANQTENASVDNGSGNGDATHHACSSRPGEPTSTTMSWSFSASSFCWAGITLQSDLATDPNITSVTSTDLYVRPEDKDIPVVGTNLAPSGTTELWLAATPTWLDDTKTQQSISSVTGTGFDWDYPDLGHLRLGDGLYLFVVTEAGTSGERVSAPFPVTVTNRDVRHANRRHTTNGTASLQTVVSGLPFKPQAAFIQVVGATSEGTIESQSAIGHCFVSRDGVAGCSCGSQETGPEVHKRQQAFGSDSLIVVDPTSDAADPAVLGTPALTEDGLEIDFSENTSGHVLNIWFLGGRSVQAKVVEVQISDGSYSGLGFGEAPELLMCMSSGQTQGETADTTFARMSVGFAKGSGTANQWSICIDQDSSDRDTAAIEGFCMNQLSAPSFTWGMSITAFTSDGFTWSGSNSDSGYIMALHLDGADIFMDQWANTETTAVAEDLPDSSIANPGVLVMACAGRDEGGPPPKVGGRWSFGMGWPGEIQNGSTMLFLPFDGTGEAEQQYSESSIVHTSGTASTLDHEAVLTSFGQQPEITWTSVLAAGILHNILMIEEIVGDDEEGAAV